MCTILLVIACMAGLIAPGFAQRARFEAVNAKWIDFFNKGDFSGVASLYTEEATAFPPGSPMAKGRVAIEVMWKSMAEQVGDPKITTLDVKPLGRSAARSASRSRVRCPEKSWANMSWYGKRLEATGSSPPTSGMRESRVHSNHSANPVLR
jgi:hypothetical protein